MIIGEVLAIIRLAMEIALVAIKSIPETEKAAFWKGYNEDMNFWRGIAKKLQGQP